MRLRWAALVVWVLVGSPYVRAETVVEAWRSTRSEFSQPMSVSVNPTDNSCWVADTNYGQVVRLSSAGAEVWRSGGSAFHSPQSVCVNPTDGSCWAADRGQWNGNIYLDPAVVHLSSTGVELWRSASSAFSNPRHVSVNRTDGSCWVADAGQWNGNTYVNMAVVHLSSAGVERWRSVSGTFSNPRFVSVNRSDGSCWVADGGRWNGSTWVGAAVVHLSSTGVELWRSPSGAFYSPSAVGVNPTDGSCWVAHGGDIGVTVDVPCSVVHLSPTGAWLWWSAPDAFHIPAALSVNPLDGSCWVADTYNNQAVHLSSAGTELWRSAIGALYSPQSVSANVTDGSCWVANWGDGGSNYLNSAVVHLSSEGVEVWRSASGAFVSEIYPVCVNPTDGSCWVADVQVVHLSSAGAEVWRSANGTFVGSQAFSVDPADSSLWAVDTFHNQVAHLSSAGAELWRSPSGAFTGPKSVSANSEDGSCWVADTQHSQVVHLSSAGAEEWRSAGGVFYGPECVSVNSADGSCWVADTSHHQVVHLSSAGSELWRSPSGAFYYPRFVSVNPTDGSCWAADTDHQQVVHLSSVGAELWRSPRGSFYGPSSVSVNPMDGSCWVGDICGDVYNDHVVHLSSVGAELWRSARGGFYRPWSVSVNPADGSCWVADTDHGQVVKLVVLAAPSSEFSGAPTSGVAPLPVQFADLSGNSPTSWAWDFGDGGNSTAQNPGHTYGSAGSYTVSLTATNLEGSDICTKNDYITVGPRAPVADFAAVPTGGTPPLEVLFSDLSTDAPASWSWSFGDGGNSVAQNPSHVYTDVGSYTVALTAGNAEGWSTCTRDGCVVVGTFFDVLPGHWAWAAVEACGGAGIVGGYPDGRFHPEIVVTRDQMAVFVSRALAGGDAHVPTPPSAAHFPDVPTDHWAYKYVEYAYANNIAAGYWDGGYWPDVAVDRGQMAAFIARAMVTPTGEAGLTDYAPPATPSFPDVPTGFWTFKHVEYLREQGIVGGYPDGWYHPEATVTRDQMAVFIARAFGLEP